jgi:hypothetical protein
MPDKLDVVHEQDPDDVFMSHTVLSLVAHGPQVSTCFRSKRVDPVLAFMYSLDHGSILVLD